MNKKELKEVLKPLIKQCIKEVIFEEGVLSSIISECVAGVSGQPIVEKKIKKKKPVDNRQDINEQLERTKKKMLKAMASDSYNGVNVFEGTTPAPGPSSPGANPLGGYAPGDSGVDISGILNIAGRNWSKMV